MPGINSPRFIGQSCHLGFRALSLMRLAVLVSVCASVSPPAACVLCSVLQSVLELGGATEAGAFLSEK